MGGGLLLLYHLYTLSAQKVVRNPRISFLSRRSWLNQSKFASAWETKCARFAMQKKEMRNDWPEHTPYTMSISSARDRTDQNTYIFRTRKCQVLFSLWDSVGL